MRHLLLLTLVLCVRPGFVQAQDLPVLTPTAFVWATWDFQEPPGAAVFVLDGNRQGDLLAESGRPLLLRHSTQVVPLACSDGGWFAGGSLNQLGWIVGTCRSGGVDQAVVLAQGSDTYVPLVAMTQPATSLTGLGINDYGHVVGYAFDDATGGPHGFFAHGPGWPQGPIVRLDAVFPGQDVVATVLTGFTNIFFASGYYTAREMTPDGPRSRTHGLVMRLWNEWYQWDAPGAIQTLLFDLNEDLRAVGIVTDAQFVGHSVLADPATQQWYRIESPDPEVIFTDVSGILPGEPLTVVGRLILPHPTDPTTNKVLGFRAVLKPSGFEAPQAPAVSVAAVAQSQRSAVPAPLPTITRAPRAQVVLNVDTCDEGPGMVVPLRMRAILGCQ